MLSDWVTSRNWFRRLIFFFFLFASRKCKFLERELAIFENIYIFYHFLLVEKENMSWTHSTATARSVWVPMLLVARVITVVIGQCMTSDLCGWKIILDWLSHLVFLLFSFYPYAYSFYTAAEILKCSVQGMFLSGRWVINPCLVSVLIWVSFRDWSSCWSLVAKAYVFYSLAELGLSECMFNQ